MQSDWQDVSSVDWSIPVVLIRHTGDIECWHGQGLAGCDESLYIKWMPYDLALKKLNAPLMEWQPIDSAPVNQKILVLFSDGLVESAEIFTTNFSVLHDGTRFPATHWAPYPELPKKELQLYVGMYGECRNGSLARIVKQDKSREYLYEREAVSDRYDKNGKSLCYTPGGDIIAEATKEEYIAYVTREL